MTDYSRAKEIFFTYSSSKFQMMRDGFSEEYYLYQVPIDIEKQWLIELIKRELHKLNINNSDSLFPITYIFETNCNIEYIKDIIDFIENNLDKVENQLNLLKFTQRVLENIDRLQSNCSEIQISELQQFRRKIKIIRNENV
jgi:hypothetical protein